MIQPNDNILKSEHGTVVGTVNKYQMRNSLGRLLIKNFDKTVGELTKIVNPESILEVGCGEGHVTNILLDVTDAQIRCTDIAEEIFHEPDSCYRSRVSFHKRSIYELNQQEDQANLVICCEVLEHLESPLLGLEKLAKLANPYCLLSVPREPIFRTLNFLRGAYFKDLGNSPGHIQHWSKRGFIKLVQTQFEILVVEAPLPWTVILAKVR